MPADPVDHHGRPRRRTATTSPSRSSASTAASQALLGDRSAASCTDDALAGLDRARSSAARSADELGPGRAVRTNLGRLSLPDAVAVDGLDGINAGRVVAFPMPQAQRAAGPRRPRRPRLRAPRRRAQTSRPSQARSTAALPDDFAVLGVARSAARGRRGARHVPAALHGDRPAHPRHRRRPRPQLDHPVARGAPPADRHRGRARRLPAAARRRHDHRGASCSGAVGGAPGRRRRASRSPDRCRAASTTSLREIAGIPLEIHVPGRRGGRPGVLLGVGVAVASRHRPGPASGADRRGRRAGQPRPAGGDGLGRRRRSACCSRLARDGGWASSCAHASAARRPGSSRAGPRWRRSGSSTVAVGSVMLVAVAVPIAPGGARAPGAVPPGVHPAGRVEPATRAAPQRSDGGRPRLRRWAWASSRPASTVGHAGDHRPAQPATSTASGVEHRPEQLGHQRGPPQPGGPARPRATCRASARRAGGYVVIGNEAGTLIGVQAFTDPWLDRVAHRGGTRLGAGLEAGQVVDRAGARPRRGAAPRRRARPVHARRAASHLPDHGRRATTGTSAAATCRCPTTCSSELYGDAGAGRGHRRTRSQGVTRGGAAGHDPRRPTWIPAWTSRRTPGGDRPERG